MADKTFIIDCPSCKAKVAAIEKGRASTGGFNEYIQEPYGEQIYVGICPSCSQLIAGFTEQIGFDGYNSDGDEWTDIIRIHPKPPKSFRSHRIPKVVTDSLIEADRSLQSNANIAACVMFGRALEAVCRDILATTSSKTSDPKTKEKRKRNVMLGAGLKQLHEKGFIDGRLFDWSQQLHAFRNLAAHPEDISISRRDAEDLQTFVYAIVEYIYDLTDRYNEFKKRTDKGKKT